MKHLFFIAVLFLLQGCASNSLIVKNSSNLRAGMTAEEVRISMGEPQNRQFQGENEAWQYCSTDYSGFEADHYVLIWLYKGTVTGMQTYRNTLYGSCESFFRTVDWEEAPDVSIEIRNK